MTMTAAGKVVAVIVLKAVLLGAPIQPGMEAPAGGYSMSAWGTVAGYDQHGQEHMSVQADQVLRDADAGLLVAVGPHKATVDLLFGNSAVEADVSQVLLRPDQDAAWPPAALEFPWPREGSAYYLQEIEPDLFRRTELAAKEGYEISATFRGEDAVEVELELARRSFTGGDYEDSLDAWTERPLAVRSVVSTTVPLTEERPTLVVWRSPLQPTEGSSLQTGAAPAAGPPPAWAVGTWRLETKHEGGADLVPMVVQADGGGVISPDRESMRIEVDASGRVSGQMVDGEATITLTGTLRQDGTGSGRVVARGGQMEEQMTWTATRLSGEVPGWAATGPAAGPPPEWAVGTWLVTAEGIEARMTIGEDGQGVIALPQVPVHLRVDASGRVSTGEQLVPHATVTIAGALAADGTGSGVIVASYGDKQEQVEWTAIKAGAEPPDDAQASATSSAPIRLAQLGGGSGFGGGGLGGGSRSYRIESMRPMGLAVLLELRRWVYEPASQEMRQEFEPLARALEQATGGRARLDLQQTQTPAEEYIRVVPIASEAGEVPGITVDDTAFTPVVGLWLCNETFASNTWRKVQRINGVESVSFPIQRLHMPAGSSVLAESTSGNGELVVVVPGEWGLVEPEAPAASPFSAGVGSMSMRGTVPSPSVPELPFAELASPSGAVFRLWGPAGGDGASRMHLDLPLSLDPGRGGGSLTVGMDPEVASVPPPVRPINVDVHDMALGDVIRMLSQAADTGIAAAPGVDVDKVIERFAMTNATVDRILQALLEPLGLEFTKRGSIYVVHKPGELLGGVTGGT